MAEKIRIEGVINKTISYSMHQNGIYALKTIRISNLTEEEWEGLRVSVSFMPEYAESLELSVMKLSAYEKVEIKNPVAVVNADYFVSLTEKETGSVKIEVYHGEELLGNMVQDIELLPYGQWSGMVYMPELLCSFVMPNHPSVTTLLSSASKWLETWKSDPSILGYSKQDPNDVKMQVAAVYEAMRQENIAYSLPPASYESVGQKIRTPDEVLGQKFATCLDLTVLYASVLEAMRLNPLIILKNDHAFIGCWLEEKTFAECIQEDISAIHKRIAEGIDELILVECTSLVAGSQTSFEESVKIAKNSLLKEEEFKMAIDVARCRGSNIRPMPARVMEEGTYRLVEYKSNDMAVNAPEALSTAGRGAVVEENQMTKQKLWERKLLDLSLRNMLLNFRVTKNCVQLMVNDPAQLEDALSHGDDFAVFPIPQESTLTPGQDKIYVLSESEELQNTMKSEFASKRIRTFLPEEQLATSMKFLQRQAKHSMEENGSNTLYMALGVLKWYESDVSTKERYAPLVMVPVDLTKRLQDKHYHIKIRDEEAQINVTLLEFLRQDFGMDIGGLDPLPTDEAGLDMPLILNTIRQSVMEKKHWDVLPYAFLGIFSFSRFIMWNDIRNRSKDILSNKVVASLISGKMEWDAKELCDSATLDKRVKPNEMAVVMSADSSQMVAIEMAAKGESFVLHGPPGTGKSQTITNMIANALYQGKSVLFVAEKMAALSVVQKRLEKVGLAPFCLELHSNKAQKQAVLSQLERTLKATGATSTEEYAKQAERLYQLRTELNDVVEALHTKLPVGFSVYELIGKYERNREFAGILDFSAKEAQGFDAEKYMAVLDSIQRLQVVARECEDINKHPLSDFRTKNYSMQMRADWEACLDRYQMILADLVTVLSDFSKGFEIKGTFSLSDIRFAEQLTGHLLQMERVSEDLLSGGAALTRENEIRAFIKTGAELKASREELLAHYKPDILDYDVTAAKQRYITAQGKFFITKKMEINALVKELKFLALDPRFVTEQNLETLYERIALYKNIRENTKSDAFFENAFAGVWQKDETDWNKLSEFYEKHLLVCQAIQKADAAGLVKQAVQKVIAEKRMGAVLDANRQICASLLDVRKNALAEENKLMSEYGLQWSRFEAEADFVSSMQESIRTWKQNTEELRSYTAFCEAENTLNELGLGVIVEGFRKNEFTAEQLLSVFECNFAKALAMAEISDKPVLAQFNGAGFNAAVASFCEVSDQFELLTRQEIVAKLSARIPKAGEGIAQSSELGILQKAIKSQRRAMPIRKLFNQIPTLLGRMCPCMLMSPISVAQYIDPSFPKFDLVIFDEASQLPTGESVGALARGENVIVVGDPKQLPPTSFFMTNQQNEEELDVEDMESLLDDCLALSLPQKHLLWHYRSRHESLIAYSNMMYYDNLLYTFPSPNDLVSEVKWVHVEGEYDRGKTKQNRAEAEAVVTEIIRRLEDEELRKNSIGVVTFSSVQQELIDDLLQEALHAKPELEVFALGGEEPIFIKNLENVQGDERDVILFSIGYGPDKDGRVGLNFGPLNQEGGWRRLNVAITRSRKSMMIFSTLRPEQLDLSRTTSEGLVGLKGFLEFAARGKNALYTRNDVKKPRNSDVARAIVARLNEAGYQANLDIGTSEYKVDIGVVNPENPDTYCLGILCDGENYMAAGTARDRNLLQPQVLEGLGWKLHRVWTLDWMDTPDREFSKIVAAIEKALAPEPACEEVSAEAEIDAAPETEILPESEEIPEGCEAAVLTTEDVVADGETVAEETTGELAGRVSDAAKEAKHYVRQTYSVGVFDRIGDSEEFYQEKTKLQIAKMVERVLQAEAPIEESLLKRRVFECWGLTRETPRVTERFEEVFRNYPMKQTTSGGKNFIWLDNMNPLTYSIYRVPAEGDKKRSVEQIPAEEIINAVKEILDKNVALAKDDLMKETVKIFGYTRVNEASAQMVNVAISYAEQRGYAVISEDGLRVSQKA